MGKKRNNGKKPKAKEEEKENEVPLRLVVLAVRYCVETDTYTHMTAVGQLGEPLLYLVADCYRGQLSKKHRGLEPLWDKCKETIDGKKEAEPSGKSFFSTASLVVGKDAERFDPSIVTCIQTLVNMPKDVEYKEVSSPEWAELISCIFQVQGPMFQNNSAVSSLIVHVGNRLVRGDGFFGKRTMQGFRTTDFTFMLLPCHPDYTDPTDPTDPADH